MTGTLPPSSRRRRENDRRELAALADGSGGAVVVCRVTDDGIELLLRQPHLVGPGRVAPEATVRLALPASYPLARPVVTFGGPAPFHPNVYTNGSLCINDWRPSMRLGELVATIAAFLAGRDQNPDSPANGDAVSYYRAHAAEIRRTLRPVPLASSAGGLTRSRPSPPVAPRPQFRVVQRG